MFRSDRNKHGGGIMFYINKNNPCKTVDFECLSDGYEVTSIELAIKIRKWRCIGLYKRRSQMYSISLKIYHLLGLKCLVNKKILCWLGISALLLKTKILKFLWIHLRVSGKSPSGQSPTGEFPSGSGLGLGLG